MSKNYELLQQANFGLGNPPAFAVEETSAISDKALSASAQVLSFLEPVAREEVLKLVQHLFLSMSQTTRKAVLFAGVDANNGCNWLSVATAKLLASCVPGSVCLVEGNLRLPVLSDSLHVYSGRGLVDAVRENGTIREFAVQAQPENLWVLPAGVRIEDPGILLRSDRMKDRVNELRKEFDYVVMNAPALNSYADGIVLSGLLEGVVLVLEANATRREAAVRVTDGLRAANIPVLGAVLNNRTFPIPAALYKRL